MTYWINPETQWHNTSNRVSQDFFLRSSYWRQKCWHFLFLLRFKNSKQDSLTMTGQKDTRYAHTHIRTSRIPHPTHHQHQHQPTKEATIDWLELSNDRTQQRQWSLGIKICSILLVAAAIVIIVLVKIISLHHHHHHLDHRHRCRLRGGCRQQEEDKEEDLQGCHATTLIKEESSHLLLLLVMQLHLMKMKMLLTVTTFFFDSLLYQSADRSNTSWCMHVSVKFMPEHIIP